MTEPENGHRIIMPGEPEPVRGPEVQWDKDAPTGPPTPVVDDYPEWFKPVHAWFQKVVLDESVVAKLCLERAAEIVEKVHNAGMVGTDYFPTAEGGGGLNRTGTVAMAVPLAVEIYRQVSTSIEKREAELEKVIKNARANAPAA